MTSKNRMFGSWSYQEVFIATSAAVFFFSLSALPTLADGCFVFKWNKRIDINEPAQKAIIIHDAGREDLLLQVKYEGPLEEFGWLIPVPALPTVEQGSMDAFYELSELTQRQFGMAHQVVTMGTGGRGIESAVTVIEIKTVGAYEVAILSAREANSLDQWLRAHDYSLPEDKAGIVEEYVRKGWYFVAARIHLSERVGFKLSSNASPAKGQPPASTRKELEQKLSSGELHPLLISFDTPACIFPLKISAVGGKPSEVSLYVLSSEPLLNRFIFDEACEKVDRRRIEWENQRPMHEQFRQTSMQNTRALGLAAQMYMSDQKIPGRAGRPRDWSTEDLFAMNREGQPPTPLASLDEGYYGAPSELLQCLRASPENVKRTAKSLPRVKGRSWYVTKVARTFAPAEMRDLEFEPAIPALASVLSRPSGRVAALILSSLGANTVPVLLTACGSRNSTERANAAFAFEGLQDGRFIEPALNLLKDESPPVRLHAVRAASRNWDDRLTGPLLSLFHDPEREIRSEAAACFAGHDDRGRTAVYLDLLKDPDPNARVCSLGVLLRLSPDVIPPEPLIELVRNPDLQMQEIALHTVWKMDRDVIPRADLLPLLGSPRMDIVTLAWKLIEGSGRVKPSLPEPAASAREQEERKRWLTSSEAAPLATNQLTMARLLGLRILGRNADAEAIEIILPLLKDPSQVVRNRAFAILRSVTAQNVSEDDPAKWEQWWAANRSTFKAHPLTSP